MNYLMELLPFVPLGIIINVGVLYFLVGDEDNNNNVQKEETKQGKMEKGIISESSDGKKYLNIFEVIMEDENVRLEGYSNAIHSVRSFLDYCDRVNDSGDGIIISSAQETTFIPIDKVHRITVRNEEIC